MCCGFGHIYWRNHNGKLHFLCCASWWFSTWLVYLLYRNHCITFHLLLYNNVSISVLNRKKIWDNQMQMIKKKGLLAHWRREIENSSTEQSFIYCSNSNKNLTKSQSYKSWKVLLDAVKMRQHQTVVEKAWTVPENEVPDILYCRECRSIFTLKDTL